MTNETKNETTAEVSTRKNRRGVSNETKAVSQLKFHEKDAAQNGLFIGHLAEVTLDWSVGKEGTAFAGLKQPRLTFHFASQHANVNEQRHVYNSLFPVASNIATIPNGTDAWQVDNVLNWIKHMLDVYYLKGRMMTEAEEDALTLPFCDFDDNGEYISVDPEEVLKGYATVFANTIAMLEGRFGLAENETPKCAYKTADGKPIAVWMKLLRHKKTKKGWTNVLQNGELGFDSFIGAGCIEIFKGNGTNPAILRLDLSKESITPKDTKKEPTLGGQMMSGMMGGAVMPGAMPTGIPNDNSAFAAAGNDDLPF